MRTSIFILLTLLFSSALFAKEAVEYELYTPESAKKKENPPMVVMMHGCTQSAGEFMDLTRIKEEADKRGFVVMAPQKNLKFVPPNNPLKCWAWYWPSSNKRDPSRGELKKLMDMVEKVKKEQNIDPDNVYVAGFSAGAVMSSIMANCYPDVFKGAMIHSGLPFKGLRYSAGSNIAVGEEIKKASVNPGGGDDCERKLAVSEETEKWAGDMELVLEGLPWNERRRVAKLVKRSNKCSKNVPEEDRKLSSVTIFQGSKDKIVWDRQSNNAFMQFAANESYAGNGDLLMMSVNDKERKPAKFVQFESEKIKVNMMNIEGMGHAWSGGKEGYRFSDPQGHNATKLMLDQFGL